MSQAEQVGDLLKQLDAQRDAYIESFRQIHELLAQNLAATTSQPAADDRILHRPSITGPRSPRPSVTHAASERRAGGRKSSAGLATLTTSSESRRTGDDSDVDADDEDLYVSVPLGAEKYDEETLRSHLRAYKWNQYGAKILASVIDSPTRLQQPQLIHNKLGEAEDRSHLSHYSVYDVGADGAPLPVDFPHIEREQSKAQAIWHAIKEINQPPKERLAVGRITILREPSPMLFGAAHHTLSPHFDVDELFKHLIDVSGTSPHMHRSFDDDLRKQKSFVFSFEYFTIIGPECVPMKWQLADQQDERKAGHIAVTRCSSVVALALTGPAIRKVRNPHRRAKNAFGFAYDPWSAWHVLNLQCYPDWHATMDIHDSTKHYVNGVEAFLTTLLGEYRDAQKRFEQIYKEITKLVTPPLDFIFNSDLRDTLLFEDSEFTYSRRYFWAYQTLGMMNDSIKLMVDAYEDTFTDDVWEGTHKTLWPLLEQNSSRNVYFKKKMASLRAKFEKEMVALRKIIEENDDRREEINGLKEELFKGTSIQESRKSVENTEVSILQGHNIKILTMVSLVFIPLTFVTSVFGMTNMPSRESYWLFGCVTVAVCVPFFVLIGSLNTTTGMRFWRAKTAALLRNIGRFLAWLISCGGRRKDDSDDEDDMSESDSGIGNGSRTQFGYRLSNAQSLRARTRPLSRQRSRALAEDLEARKEGLPAVDAVRPELDRSPSSMLAKMMMHERKRTLRYSTDV
ncbi:hypothetical protein B0A48_04070 [Cryoendolithus antarcticus]|uniref:Uncharacterized protein n=1 Tax=Cryoendolithus antarcticus TaxID=1507870 RepID=A0A1V8THD4_9PEZI|nr:hypothetical protein B0A48_04070 [Cryoendolithus antarcticus]